MAKIKNKKKLSSDIVHSKKVNSSKKKLNPFEVHINKEKIRVLGKKQKNDTGLPGISRAKAIEKRKTTLLQEYKLQNKTNKFNDKRLGEWNYNFSEEDKNIARYTALRAKAHKKKSIFNLADDLIVTHHGQILSEIEMFDDPRSDDESIEDGNPGKLTSAFVKEAHFGGRLLKSIGEGVQTHKNLIDQLIAESKKHKAEKQKVKEATLELTEKLDTEWKDLIPLVSQNKSNNIDNQINKVDDYDKLLRELKFAARGTVSDRLKTEDEVAKEEKERLEQLEKERLLRMKGDFKENNLQAAHRSADDLDDTVYEDITDDLMLTYNDEGKPNVKIEGVFVDMNGKPINNEPNSNDEDSEQEASESENVDSEDSLADLKNDSSEEECNEKKSEDIKDLPEEELVVGDALKLNENSKETFKEDIDLLKRKQAMEELPYTFTFPDSYESLQRLFENQSTDHLSIILERLIKCNHHSLAEGNKDKLGLLFAYLLQFLNDIFEDCSEQTSLKESFDIFQVLIPKLYDLAQMNPENAHHSLLEVIKEKHEDYRRHPKQYPGLEVLVFLKLISILLPTSDFRHQVVTPCFVFMEQLLRNCKVETRRDISYGLFLITLILEYTSTSKRFMPAAINFLSGILHKAIPKTGVKLIKVLPPFKATSSDLVLVENMSSYTSPNSKMNCSYLLNVEIEEKYKIDTLYATITILEEFHASYKHLPSCVEIFSLVLKYLEAINMDYYPKLVKDAHDGLLNALKKSVHQRSIPYIVMQAMKPKALRMFEPKIEEVFDMKMHRNRSKGKAEREKLVHKFKQEKKGALREIRRDKDFLGRVKVKQRIRSDTERREKVKRIYSEAASQQNELKAFDRKKKHKK